MKSLKTVLLSLIVLFSFHFSFAQGTVVADCVNGLNVSLMEYQNNVQVTLTANDFNANSYSSITPAHQLIFRVNRLYDVDGNGVLDEMDHLTSIPEEEEMTLTCTDLNEEIKVQMWVMDGQGNMDYCICAIELDDFCDRCNDCGQALYICVEDISGQTPSDLQASLIVGNSNQTLYPNCSCWSDRCEVPRGLDEDYVFSVTKSGDVRAGMTTYDMVLIAKHILNVQRLDSPYKILAADLNQSGSVTTLDLLLMRKLILRIDDQSTQLARAWRFIPKDFEFPNPDNPWETPIPDKIIINGIDLGWHEYYANFIGIKMGDVN